MTPSELAITALKNARETFQRYGDLHAAKSPPQPEKAGVNYDMVTQINTALLALAQEAAEDVRSSDVFDLTPSMATPGPPAIPAQARLKEFISTLGERDDDSFVSYNALLGDLRALTLPG